MIVTARREAKGAKRRTLVTVEVPPSGLDFGKAETADGTRYFIDWAGEEESVTLSLSEAEAKYIVAALQRALGNA